MKHSKQLILDFVDILAALLLVIIVIAVILLNHAEELKLDQRLINSEWLMQLYLRDDLQADASFLLNNTVISQFNNELFFNDQLLTNSSAKVLGGVALDDVLVLAAKNQLILISPSGDYLETLSADDGIPAQIQNIGEFHGEPVLQTRQGMFRSNYLLDQWEPVSLQGVSWSEYYPLPAKLKFELKKYFFDKGISIEQLIRDCITGQLFRSMASWFWDFILLFMLAVCVRGLLLRLAGHF